MKVSSLMRRQRSSNTRSGRFKFDDATGGKIIVTGRTNAVYRIYNARRNDFKVKNAAATPLDLLKGNSIDILLNGDLTVLAKDMTTKDISGIYELLNQDSATSIRPGRFKFDGATTAQTIITGSTNVFYRVYNSRRNNFIVNNATTNDLTLEKGNSLDIYVAGDVKIQGAAGDKISGIYEAVGEESDARSGRFKVTASSADKRDVIHLPGFPNGQSAYYRFYNSGDNKYKIWKGDMANTAAEFATVEKDQSLDVGMGAGRYWINGPDGAYEGIYEFLGRD